MEIFYQRGNRQKYRCAHQKAGRFRALTGERRPCGSDARERHRKAFESAASALGGFCQSEAPGRIAAEDARRYVSAKTGGGDVEDIWAKSFALLYRQKARGQKF